MGELISIAIQILFFLIVAIVSTFVVPFLKSKLSSSRWDMLKKLVSELVKAAEKLFPASGEGENKYKFVREILENERGIEVTQEVHALIEAAVYELD
jgi:uncharacterized protein (UPF0333 family)